MSMNALKSVDDHRRTLLWAAASHPLFWIPASAVAFVLAVNGLLLAIVAFFFLDGALFLGLMRSRRLRERMMRRLRVDARRRAAETLDLETHREWRRVSAIVDRTERLRPWREDHEALLDTFVNVALALSHAIACAEKTDSDVPRSTNGPVGDIARDRRHTRARIDGAIATLRGELELTAQMVCASCEKAIAEQCETCADLWIADVAEARGAHVIEEEAPAAALLESGHDGALSG